MEWLRWLERLGASLGSLLLALAAVVLVILLFPRYHKVPPKRR